LIGRKFFVETHSLFNVPQSSTLNSKNNQYNKFYLLIEEYRRETQFNFNKKETLLRFRFA